MCESVGECEGGVTSDEGCDEVMSTAEGSGLWTRGRDGSLLVALTSGRPVLHLRPHRSANPLVAASYT